jgi:hypothetical protein
MDDSETNIGALSQDLARLRRRAVRQKRDIQSSPAAWQRWSSTMDEVARLTKQLVAATALDVASLAEKFRAILWLIEINESLLDQSDLARLRRFSRELSLSARK